MSDHSTVIERGSALPSLVGFRAVLIVLPHASPARRAIAELPTHRVQCRYPIVAAQPDRVHWASLRESIETLHESDASSDCDERHCRIVWKPKVRFEFVVHRFVRRSAAIWRHSSENLGHKRERSPSDCEYASIWETSISSSRPSSTSTNLCFRFIRSGKSIRFTAVLQSQEL